MSVLRYVLAFTAAFTAWTAAAQNLVIGSFNAESGSTADPKVVAGRIEAVGHVHVWGLSEVSGETDAKRFRDAAAAAAKSTFGVVVGSTGSKDRLAVLYDEGAVTFRRKFELLSDVHTPCVKTTARAPLLVEFEHKATKRVFWFMVNHLQRGDADVRLCQSRKLNDWAKKNTIAMIAVGDYNYDWKVKGGDQDHDKGYDVLTADGRFKWVRPAKLVRTQCSPQYDSVLDFVFVTARAKSWPGRAEILFPESSYCTKDPGSDSDHRPVVARFTVN